MLKKIEDYKKRMQTYKASPEFMRDQFYQKSRLKLFLITSLISIALWFFIETYMEVGYVLLAIFLFFISIVPHLGANYLTRKKFDNLEE